MTWKSALLAFCLLCGCVDHSTARLKAFDGVAHALKVYGHSFYDVASGRPLQGKIANETSSSNSSSELPSKLPFNLPRIEFNGSKCECRNYSCQCCAGLNVSALKFDRQWCANFAYDSSEYSIDLNVTMNENSIYNNSLSARHPPPVCLPLPYLPFLHFCLRFFDLRLPNGTAFHTCIDFEARIIHAPLLILHFDCVDIGSNGLSWSKPQIGNDQLINNSYVEELTSSTFGSVSSTTSTTTTTTSPTTIDWDPVEFETTTESDGLPINGTTLSPEQEDKIGEHRLRHA
ncbi:hypothetical protein TKK_0014879 [Trichogramma kaykai]